MMPRPLCLLLLLITALCWGLIMLGAYVRLSDAGLGCPDWPGCYGQLTVPDESHEIAHAERHFGQEVDPARGFKEMLHRYVAGTLGLLLLALAVAGWRKPAPRLPRLPLLLPVGIVIFQALLGMWTVTEKLMPAVVTAHLLGGMLLLASLVWLASRTHALPAPPAASGPGWLLAGAVLLQIALGGWVSSNYAGPACSDFPLCAGQWLPADGLFTALRPDRPLGLNADGTPLQLAQLAGIHWLHRLGALLVLLLAAWQCRSLQRAGHGRLAGILALLIAVQIALGIANALYAQPLPLAVLHNGIAALLLAGCTWLAASPLPRRSTCHDHADPVCAHYPG